MPNEHCDTLLRDLEMLGAGCTITLSLFCNLKWLLLSSRLQGSCCPRSWSLRSKMRLPQCCETGSTQRGRRGEEKNLQYSARLLWHLKGHLFKKKKKKLRLYLCNVWVHFLFLTCCCSRAYKCGALYGVTQIFIHMQSAKCIFIDFDNGFFLLILTRRFYLRRVFIFKCEIY